MMEPIRLHWTQSSPNCVFSSFQRKVSTVCLSFHLYKSSFDYSLADGRGRPAR
jgi:hypothetical protein